MLWLAAVALVPTSVVARSKDCDAQTRALIAAIRELKSKTPATSIAAVPPACAHEAPRPQGRALSPSTLNGTYRWRLTEAGAMAAGIGVEDPYIGTVSQMTLRDGKWLMEGAGLAAAGGGGDWGSYEIVGNRIVFDWPQVADTLTFTFKRHANGDLDLKPVLPMDRGDRFMWASAPWRRVGQPVREIP